MKVRVAVSAHNIRPLAVVAAALFTALAVPGCEQVNMRRFSSATRIDAILNPGWREFEEPFESQVARLRESRVAVCTDPDSIGAVHEILARCEDRWTNHWAVPPESPPVVLVFHNKKQWLGTLDVYASALGHVHNLIRRITPGDAAEILRIVCDCADASGDSAPSARR